MKWNAIRYEHLKQVESQQIKAKKQSTQASESHSGKVQIQRDWTLNSFGAEAPCHHDALNVTQNGQASHAAACCLAA